MKSILRLNVFPFLCIGFFCLLSLGQLQRIEWGNLPAFYLHDLCLVLYVLWHVKEKDFCKNCWEYVRKISRVEGVLLSWVGAGLLIAAVTGSPIFQPLLYLVRFGLYALSGASLFYDLRTKKLLPNTVWYSLFLFSILHILFGLLQYFLVPDTRMLFFLGWDDHYYRLISTMLDPGFAGILYVIGFFISCSWLVHSENEKTTLHPQTRVAAYVIALACVICIALTYSRASYLAFFCSAVLSLFFTWKKHVRLFFFTKLCIFLLIALIPFLPRPGGEGVKLERTSTIIARTNAIQESLNSFTKPYQFILGQGLFVGHSREVSQYSGQAPHAKQPDNWLILLFTGTGTVGVALCLGVFLQHLSRLKKLTLFFWIAAIALLIHGLFNASMTYPFVIIVLGSWCVLENNISP